MKRFIASDIDGTMLPYGQYRISKSIISLIEELDNLGVLFMTASGRQLPSQKMLFEEVADKVLFIAENGALVEFQGKTILEKTMSPTLVHEIITDILKQPGCEPVISTRDTVYISKRADEYLRSHDKEILYTTTVTDDFFSCTEDVLKVTACDFDGIIKHAGSFANSWKRFANVFVSGAIYCDFTDLSVSKGNALSKVMDILGFNADDGIVFGDNYNDVSMFGRVKSAFAMEHADDDVKQYAGYFTDDVEHTIRKIYNLIP